MNRGASPSKGHPEMFRSRVFLNQCPIESDSSFHVLHPFFLTDAKRPQPPETKLRNEEMDARRQTFMCLTCYVRFVGSSRQGHKRKNKQHDQLAARKHKKYKPPEAPLQKKRIPEKIVRYASFFPADVAKRPTTAKETSKINTLPE